MVTTHQKGDVVLSRQDKALRRLEVGLASWQLEHPLTKLLTSLLEKCHPQHCGSYMDEASYRFLQGKIA